MFMSFLCSGWFGKSLQIKTNKPGIKKLLPKWTTQQLNKHWSRWTRQQIKNERFFSTYPIHKLQRWITQEGLVQQRTSHPEVSETKKRRVELKMDLSVSRVRHLDLSQRYQMSTTIHTKVFGTFPLVETFWLCFSLATRILCLAGILNQAKNGTKAKKKTNTFRQGSFVQMRWDWCLLECCDVKDTLSAFSLAQSEHVDNSRAFSWDPYVMTRIIHGGRGEGGWIERWYWKMEFWQSRNCTQVIVHVLYQAKVKTIEEE